MRFRTRPFIFLSFSPLSSLSLSTSPLSLSLPTLATILHHFKSSIARSSLLSTLYLILQSKSTFTLSSSLFPKPLPKPCSQIRRSDRSFDNPTSSLCFSYLFPFRFVFQSPIGKLLLFSLTQWLQRRVFLLRMRRDPELNQVQVLEHQYHQILELIVPTNTYFGILRLITIL